jgi:5-(carboxyamino)imidazole ribonucleotide synthase
MNYFSSDFTLGILGGGQLGKMLLQETRKWDVTTAVLDPSGDAPCRLSTNRFETGVLMDEDTVYRFGQSVDVLTIEIEHVNLNALYRLEAAGVQVIPPPKSLEIIANKGRQKLFYRDHQIPTADFSTFAFTSEIQESIDRGALSFPFVWKSTQFGYDGQGVKIVRHSEDLKGLPQVECIAETLVPFAKELAVIVCRNHSGQEVAYPAVEMEFHPEANQVEYVLCPAQITPSIREKAEKIAMDVARKINHIGLLAVELFLTPEGAILVNEIAPRPHNSGHFTIEASVTNQFEQHLRAVLNLPLGDTSSKTAAVMVNLVGDEGSEGPVSYENMEKILELPGVTPHLYGKKITRPFRKMGHVTITDPDPIKARAVAQQVKELIRVVGPQLIPQQKKTF